MAFSLQLADDDQRDDHFVLGKPRTGPWVGQQHGRVENVGANGGIGHVALLERGVHAVPHEPLGGYCGTRAGTGPFESESTGAARIAEHVASHRKRRYSREGKRGVQARRVNRPATQALTNGRNRGSSASPQAAIRSEITWRSAASSKMPASAMTFALVGVGVDVRADDVEFGGAARDRLDRLVAAGVQAVRDEVVEELLVALLVAGDPADQTVQHRLVICASRLRL